MNYLLKLPCGGTARFDESSGISYRCEDCFAVIGSIGMPRDCKEACDSYDAWEKIGGVGWDYKLGQEKAHA